MAHFTGRTLGLSVQLKSVQELRDDMSLDIAMRHHANISTHPCVHDARLPESGYDCCDTRDFKVPEAAFSDLGYCK
jgi:hypothetical protein